MLSALRTLPRTVWLLGLVSLLNDAASDLVYPLLPLYLAGVLGAGPRALGLIEGCAEAAASLLKLVSGVLADRRGAARPWVLGGYGLAALARPLIAFAASWPAVLGLRVLDRIGKGLRSSPRDALLARSVAPASRGLAFGVHRAMDNAGAVAGPLLAALLLGLGVPLRDLFLWTALPGALTVWLIWRVPEPPAHDSGSGAATPGAVSRPAAHAGPPAATSDAAADWRWHALPPALRRYLGAYALFTLGNSSNLFLLLRARELGISEAGIPLLWALVSAVAALGSAPLAGLSDRIGRRRLIAGGWIVYALVYAVLGVSALPSAALWALFAVYGLFLAATEGAEKACVADLAPVAQLGRAFGWFHLIAGLCLLPASLLFGALWSAAGAGTACGFAAACALLAAYRLLRDA